MRQFWEKYHIKIIASILAGVLMIGVMAVIALFSGAVMSIFGLQYRSVGSMVLFFILASLISLPFNLIADSIPKALLHLGKIPRHTAIPLYLLLDSLATAFGLRLVDYFMESVSATDFAVVVVSLLLALISIQDIDKKPKGVE